MSSLPDVAPDLTVIVVVYDMLEEAMNTLYSFSRSYQRGIEAIDYEVIVVDNGSPTPFPATYLDTLAGAYRLIRIDDASQSPAHALNIGASDARADRIAFLVDGARIASPEILAHAWKSFDLANEALVATLAWHIGPEVHRIALERLDHSKQAEIEMLDRVQWKTNGHRLFEISSLAGANRGGWFAPMPESSCLFLSRKMFDAVGGFDERFDQPGGGLLTWDFYRRCCEHDAAELVTLLGEGTFHQMHGGAMTSAPSSESPELLRSWLEQYESIRRKPWALPTTRSRYFGHFPEGTERFIQPR